MLSSPAPASILRAACIRSQSHPLQHNLLDLCLDLALGRLAVTVAHHGGDPVPSNAFVAVLKRAQARPYRRTGGAGGKVELEKLVVSVLDDPSVDRVMRAVGFSSSHVRDSVVASLEESTGAGCDVVARSPNPVADGIIAGGGQPCLQTVPVGSGCQASKAKSGVARPATFDGTEPEKTTANIPPWLRRFKDKTPIRLTYSGTSLQADAACRRRKFTELTATNLKILCDALELRVPWHGNIVPSISTIVLRCRSGVTRTKPSGTSSSTWLLFLGRDGGGKMAVARELARLVFGSYAEFTALQVQGNADIPAHGSKLVLKRPRSTDTDNDGDLMARLFEAVRENPHRVILIDGVDRLDCDSEMQIKNAVTGGGMVRGCNGDVVGLEDAIIVLSASDVLDSRYLASSSSPRVKRRFSRQNREEGGAMEMEVRSRHRQGLDLNVCTVDEEDSLADDDGILNVVDGVFLFN
uniref:Clp R domain-containing protein n=2 Tax=Aegilops tauschii TaxID=37682 RepID=N1QUF4_AEGTA